MCGAEGRKDRQTEDNYAGEKIDLSNNVGRGSQNTT
jgi:hypothetical protein